MRRFCHPGASAILIGMLMCASAFAQQKNQGPPNALQGFSQNRDEPVKIQAASLEVREKEKIATFTGDVQVFQGDTEMRCKSLVVLYDEDPAAHGVKAAERVKAPISRFSSTVMRGNRRRASGTGAIPRRTRSAVDSVLMTSPA